MFEFLCGGRSSGEAVRLKLQTPLFVADALLEAAGKLLEAELQTAEEVRYMTCGTLRCNLCPYCCVRAHMPVRAETTRAHSSKADKSTYRSLHASGG